MGILSHILGWNWRVRRLRKRWDRLREKSLRKKNPVRMQALERLDMIASNLSMLEEQRLSRIDRARISKELEINLEEAKAILEMKPGEVQAIQTKKRMQKQ